MISPNQIQEFKNIVTRPQRLEEERNVLSKYGTIFNPENLDKLTKEDFKSFLLIKNNKHWDGIHRQGNIVTQDMDKLKKALKILLDETKTLKERLDFLFPPRGESFIKGLGRALVTPILLMVYPHKYGVYNTKSEEGLRVSDMLPDFNKKSFAEKYIEVNMILNDFANEHGLTLWQTDEVIGWLSTGNSPIIMNKDDQQIKKIDGEIVENENDFALESHLEDFLVDNWEKLDIGKNYDILEIDGETVGQQYITPIGRMDILTKSKDGKEILVLELKKGRSGDAVVGQTLRYITWLKENLATNGERVKGLVVVGQDDEKLRYSLRAVENIDLMTYSVSFKLNSISK